jgi:hypothetical protein
MNVIWSPDAGAADETIGHGAGKTMFCRLLRYCLGEDSVGPEAQRQRLANRLPNARVSAEIVLDGEIWVVSRVLAHRRQDVAIKGGNVTDILGDDVAATGIEPLRAAIAASIIGDAAKLMPNVIGEASAWQAALAWLTRDQEVRLEHHLEWRSSQTESHVRIGRSKEDRLNAVRAFLGMLTVEEIAAQKTETDIDREVKKHQAQLEFLNQLIDRSRQSLVQSLGSGMASAEGTDIELTHFRRAASEKFAAVVKLPAGTSNANLMDVRNKRDVASKKLNDTEAAIDTNVQVTDLTRKLLANTKSELPTSQAKVAKAGNPVCPICSVPIDKVLAEGCKITLESCNLDELNKQVDEKRKAIKSQEVDVSKLEGEAKSLKIELALAKQSFEQADKTLKALEASRDKNTKAFQSAQRLIDDTTGYARQLEEKATTAAALAKVERRLREARDNLAKHRESARGVVSLLSERFNHVVTSVVQNKTNGEVQLDGNGLSLMVNRDGDLSTAAIDSVKVLAFDVASMLLAIEGKARLPSFFVHDSPREADLGQSIYDRLFSFMKSMEGVGPAPLFQYIITTTTAPPEEFRTNLWLILELHGSPSTERLLKTDL